MRSRSALVFGPVVAVVVRGLVALRLSGSGGDEAAGQNFEIVRDESIGGFASDGTIAAAAEALGPPVSRTPFRRRNV